LGLIKTFSRGG